MPDISSKKKSTDDYEDEEEPPETLFNEPNFESYDKLFNQ